MVDLSWHGLQRATGPVWVGEWMEGQPWIPVYLQSGIYKSCSIGHFFFFFFLQRPPIGKCTCSEVSDISGFCWTIFTFIIKKNIFAKGLYNKCFFSVYSIKGTVLGARNTVTHVSALSTKNQVLNFIWGPASIKEGCSKNTSKIFSFQGLVVLVGSWELHSGQENNTRKIQIDYCNW